MGLKTTVNEEKQRRIDDIKAKNMELLEVKAAHNEKLSQM